MERKEKLLLPTPLGETVTNLLKEQFTRIVDVKFTADMESDLDDIELGRNNWVMTLDEFYKDFDTSLKTAETNMEGKRVKVPDEVTDVVCELCGRNMVIKSKIRNILACPGFPQCKKRQENRSGDRRALPHMQGQGF